jgi:hypothetical protein
MAELPEGFAVVEEESPDLPKGFEVVAEDTAQSELPEGFEVVEEDEPSAGDIIKGVGTEVGAGIGGSLAGGIIGGAIGSVVPVVGTAAGAVAGSVIGGATASFFGSLLAQDIEGREEASMGRAVAAAAIGAVPGGVGKGVKGAMSIGKVVTREAAKGAAFGATEATSRAVIDKGRLPTTEELAKYGGAGALFGGALGGVTSKVGQKFAGKTPKEIDQAVARGEVEYTDFKPMQNNLNKVTPDDVDGERIGEKILRQSVEETKVKAQSEAAADAMGRGKNLGNMGKLLASVVPSKFLGKKANQATIDFNRVIKAAEEVSSQVGRKARRSIKKNPTLEGPINKFLDTGEMSPEVYDVLGADLQKYDNARQALQREAIQLIDDGAYRSLDDEARKQLKITIEETMTGSQRYARREYQAFLDPKFKPSTAQRKAASDELMAGYLARNGGDFDAARRSAEEHLQKLENSFASTKAEDPRAFFGAGVDSVFKRRHNPGQAEMEYLGVVKDPVERMKGTLTGIARSVARERTNLILGRELVDSGAAFSSKLDDEMIELTLRGTSTNQPSGIYGYPQVQTALNELYVGNASDKIDNIFLNGLVDLYRGGVGLSKGVKVLLNTVAYPVQVYGNTTNLLGMGINPFSSAGRGLRLALADVPLVSRAMEGIENTPAARKALLDELEDMARYGIKSANVLESDIRSTLDSGPFSKLTQKALDPFGKAYQVPDTLGRYVGWKANQKTLRKLFPNAPEEVIKRQAASMINDTYQNYDKLSNVVRTLSRWGVMPQFASFTAEFMRNQYNQGKMIARMLAGNFGSEFAEELGTANLARMRAEGTKRLASLLGVYGGTYAAIEGVKAASGVDEQTEADLRDIVYAPWDKDRSQLVKLDKDGKSGWIANPSYVVPHAMGISALKAGLRGDDEQSLVGLLTDEMVGEGSFVFQEAARAISNQDESGDKISSQLDDLKNAQERFAYFMGEAFKPGFTRELEKFQKAKLGKGDLTLKEVGARQLGARLNPFKVEESAMFTVKGNNDVAKAAKSEYTQLLKYEEPTPAQIEKTYEASNQLYQEAFSALRRNYEAMKNPKFGIDDDKAIKIFKDAGLSSKRIMEVITNSPSDLPRTITPSTSELYSEMGNTMAEKRKGIMDIMSTDRETGKRLMDKWKREKRDQARGLSQRDILIRNMGVDDRVSFLSKNPGMIQEFRRKGVLTDDVVRALRIKGVM